MTQFCNDYDIEGHCYSIKTNIDMQKVPHGPIQNNFVMQKFVDNKAITAHATNVDWCGKGVGL